MRKRAIVTTAVLAMALGAAVARAKGVPASSCPADLPALPRDTAPLVQLAILLDTSNSMDGLIDQARRELWTIVNEFARARRYGRTATLQVALYEYGNSRLSPESGYVRRVLPFTTDLDRVSEALFALRTSGGDEYCGTVMQAALDELTWSPSPADLKVVFIAGNEPFTQGPIDYRKVCQRAARAGVTINTIHCGSREEGLRTGWSDGARLAYGAYSIIDQSRKADHVAAPQDADIARLGSELNSTYIPFGTRGLEGRARQEAQDKNAVGSGMGSATSRALTKANRLYSNAGWDLVDAVTTGGVDLGSLKDDDLPAELRQLRPAERDALVRGKAKERERLQSEINRLGAAREKHVAAARAARGRVSGETLDTVMTETLRQQAACKGIELK